MYLTEDLYGEKVRDNYHTVLLAKNLDGIRELNKLVSLSCNREHFYYTNRISFDEFLGISDNIISTSACLASPLRNLDESNPYYERLAKKYTFLEIQPHNHTDQIEYNKRLYDIAQKYNKPLIVGTDTHSSTKYKAECREILIGAKRKMHTDEDAFDLTFKTRSELERMFTAQNALPEDVWSTALDNTLLLNDMCEDFELDKSIKYPILHGSPEKDAELFHTRAWDMLDEKLEKGIIPSEQEQAFRDAVTEELRVFDKLKMCGFMLSMSELICWCKEHDMAIGTARGSVGGSRTAYVTDIIDLNPETWKTVFSRFCNEDRTEIGDIDIDCIDSDRPEIFKYIVDRFGADKTARVASFGTIKDKGVVDDVGRYLSIQYAKEHPGADAKSNPWNLENIARIKAQFEQDPDGTKLAYPQLFYYFDGLLGTKVSQSVHPAGMVISPITMDDNYGMFDKDGENCLMLDMEEAHEVGAAKYDFLVLKTVQVIRDTCRYLGLPYPKTNEIDWDDKSVWADMRKDLTAIFQFESKFAADSFKRFRTDSIYDMSLVTACIRPSGQSYRDELLDRIPHHNPSKIIDDLLADNGNYLVYQEDTIKFLQQICGLSGSAADNIRRAIGRKQRDRLEAALPEILDGYCSKSDQPREIAEEEAKEFLQILEDSASYQFGYNHSIAYCLLGYLCGYYRHYYPMEFLTAFLNDAANDEDIRNGTTYAEKLGIKVSMPKWGVSRGGYSFDAEMNVIAKGLSSIKYMSEQVAEQLYELSKSKSYTKFIDILYDIGEQTSVNARQIEILIKLDFFSEFGNQRELLRIAEFFYGLFKRGEIKKLKKSAIDGSPLEPIVKKHSIGVTKSGGEAQSYTVLDVMSLMRDVEDAVLAVHMNDLDDRIKIENFKDNMGYYGYCSGREEDRRKLYITDMFALSRKKDGKKFGYSILTQSIGSGKQSRMTVFNNVFNSCPISKGDIIYCTSFERDGQYFRLTGYTKID